MKPSPTEGYTTPARPTRITAGRDRPRILTDFDGVWTRLEGQAQAVGDARVSRLAGISGWDPDRIARCLERVAAAVAAHPLEHGWRNGGRITAYADEDPFLMNSALVNGVGLVAAGGDRECQALAARLEARGHGDLTRLGSEIFLEASRTFLERNGHEMVEGAAAILEALLQVADVVFCTNFAADAVARTWARHGVALDGTDPRVSLHGNARKQDLGGGAPEHRTFGGRPVAVDRPFYRKVLLSEMPNIVVGDVFSLDLALPLALRETVPELRGLRCCLCRTPYTPGWALDLCGSGRVPGLAGIETAGDLEALVS